MHFLRIALCHIILFQSHFVGGNMHWAISGSTRSNAMRLRYLVAKTPSPVFGRPSRTMALSSLAPMTATSATRQRFDGRTSNWGRSGNSLGIKATAALLTACLSATALYGAQCEGSEEGDKFNNTAFYPLAEPYEEGLLKVSEIHTIAYSIYGNPNGKPVLFVHGGPGGGTDPNMARYFDPKAYKIILVDQRGCGKSTPFANLVDNTTYDSVADFEKIREKLGIQKWMIFGGSWGSTLGLAYAMKHPNRVTELILRGIFLLRKKEIDWLYQGPGANYLFPEDWKQYEEAIPENERHDYLNAYGRRLRGELGEDEMRKAAKAWSIWEGRTSKLVQDPWEVVKGKFGADDFSLAFARIENHYFTNEGFFPRDGFLLEKSNIDAIRHIPTVIVQGRYDVVCPAISAYELQQAFPEAKLVVTLAGHSGFEVENIKELVAACELYKHKNI